MQNHNVSVLTGRLALCDHLRRVLRGSGSFHEASVRRLRLQGAPLLLKVVDAKWTHVDFLSVQLYAFVRNLVGLARISKVGNGTDSAAEVRTLALGVRIRVARIGKLFVA